MRVLLIHPAPSEVCKNLFLPEERVPPLGLAYIAAVLEDAGIEVKIFDNFLYGKPVSFIRNLVSNYKPDIVGISCFTINLSTALETARIIKEVLPSIKVVFGGAHATLFPKQLLENKDVDVVVEGEGEYAFRELVLRQCAEEKIADVGNISYRHKTAGIVSNPRMALIKNLDDLPFPARHLLPMKEYPNVSFMMKAKPLLTLNTSRGCPFRCSFCATTWRGSYRSFSPSRIVDEIEILVEKYNAKGVYFREDNFTASPKRVTSICDELIRRKIDIEWICESRVNLLSLKLLENMYKAGCRAMWFGVESGSQRILDFLQKDITTEQVINAFILCKKVGIKTGASFMVGIPGETKEDMRKTFELAHRIDADWPWFSSFQCRPGSELYNKVINEKFYERIDENGVALIKTKDFHYSQIPRLKG